MTHTISISPQIYKQLHERAEKKQIPVNLLAENVLSDYLSQDEEQWSKAFETLLAQVYARTGRYSAEEIEADITAAAAEVKELRRASHRPS